MLARYAIISLFSLTTVVACTTSNLSTSTVANTSNHAATQDRRSVQGNPSSSLDDFSTSFLGVSKASARTASIHDVAWITENMGYKSIGNDAASEPVYVVNVKGSLTPKIQGSTGSQEMTEGSVAIRLRDGKVLAAYWRK